MKGLNRYGGEFATWMLLAQLATEYDTLALVDELVERGMTLVGSAKAGQRLRPRIEESRTRWQRYCAALEQAIRVQWSPLSKRNAVAELNCCICLFHKGDVEASFRRTQACQFRLDGNHNRAAGLVEEPAVDNRILMILSAIPTRIDCGTAELASALHEPEMEANRWESGSR